MKTLAANIQKPLLDDRSYKFIELDNGIRCLLIHDPTAEISAAALDVNVGSNTDKSYQVPGLAHFCEHLLFMGTEKFPNENEYSQYLSKHGGHSNAYTSFEHTNYYFEINSNYLEGGLDIFSEFFKTPLFKQSCKDKEINAVDSENKKNLQNDMWRFYQLEKSLANENHPFNYFSTGNFTTLNQPDIVDTLKKFYYENYSSNIMNLTISGKEDLDTLQEFAIKYFETIENRNVKPKSYGVPIYTPEQLITVTKIKSIMDSNKLELNFIIPTDLYDKWQYSPSIYYSHLFGHESKGSIYYHLNDLGYITSLSCGHSVICKESSVFLIDIELTDLGLKNYDFILQNIFQYLHMIKTTAISEEIFEEIKQIKNIDFKFKQKQNISSYVSKLSNSMSKFQIIPPEMILNHQTMIEFNQLEIEKFGEYLDLTNLRVILSSNEFNFSQKEHWYGTEYSNDQLKPLKSITLNENYHLPKINPFLPSNFKIFNEKSLPLKKPFLLKNTNKYQVWFKFDDQFSIPKLSMNLFLHLPQSNHDMTSSILTQLYCELYEDKLNDISYYASIAGLNYSINHWRDGILIKLNGYNDKILMLLTEIVNFHDFHPTKEKFVIIKDKLSKDYKNFDYETPYYQIGNNFLTLVNEKTYLTRFKSEALKDITFEQFNGFKDTLFLSMFIESLIVGNTNITELQKIVNLLELKVPVISSSMEDINKQIKLKSIDFSTSQVVNLDLLDKDQVNSCIEYFIKVDYMGNYLSQAKLELIIALLNEPCFNQLRTKEQLGYVVFSNLRKARNYFGYRILVQSEKSCKYLITRIESFLHQMVEYLETMEVEVFERFKASLIDKKLIKLKNLSEESNKFWNSITDGYYDFELNDKLISILSTLTKEDIISFYNGLFSLPKLIVCLNSSRAKEAALKKYVKQLGYEGDIVEDVETLALRVNKDPADLYKELEANFPEYEYKEVSLEEFRANGFGDMPKPVELLSNFVYTEVHL